MKHTRWIALLLALVMVLGLMPGTALAAGEDAQKKESGYEQLSFRVNPLYEGLIDEDDYIKSEVTAPRLEVDQLYATYVTVDKAGATLRDAMEARKASVELHVKYESSNYEELINLIFMAAFDHTGVPTEGDSLQWQYAGWSGQVEYGYNDSTSMYQHDFVIDLQYYTTAAQEKELTSAVNSLLKSLNVSSKSDYQKACAVYDYICDNITYDYENLEDDSYTLKFSAYAALVNKTAVCQGYALLFYRLMLELDVDVRLIAGDGGGPHAWNIVKLGDVYYNLDSTWDAGVSDYQFFLLNTENFVDHARYLEYMTTEFHTDYPMSATDYVDGVAGEPEYFFVIGGCGENTYFGVNRDREVVIAGEGSTFDAAEIDEMGIVVWDYWADGFDKVVVEEGVTRLGSYSFQDMKNVKKVTLPAGFTEIGEYAFYGCDNLSSLMLPSSLTTICDFAFYNCSSLTKMSIPAKVKTIGRAAFNYCTGLTEVKLNSSLEKIDMEAFRDCRSLTTIVIPDSVTELGTSAFGECSNLKSVTLSKSLTSIDGYAFSNCTSLTDIEFHEGLKSISVAAFDGCTSLAEITIPASVTDLDGFGGCTGLKKITFLGEAPNIGYYAFDGVTATCYYPGGLASWTEDKLSDYSGDLTWVSTHTHSYTSVVTAPTCTEKGYTTHTCSECGDVKVDTYVDALGHSYGKPEFTGKDEGHSYTCTRCGSMKIESCTFDKGTAVKDATMDTFGVKKHTCTVCGGSYETEFVYRISGKGRCETAYAAADLLKETLGIEKFDAIIIASGTNFADALAGSFLAAQKDAPILLFQKGYEDENLNYITSNLAPGGKVYILGGSAAVPESMVEALADFDVERLSGKSRFDTNLKILEEGGVTGQEILISTGWNFADCLSASATGLPILMVDSKSGKLTDAQIEFLEAHKDNTYTIIGGSAAVSEELKAAIETVVGSELNRLSGKTREATSVKVAETYFTNPDYALLAYSRNFPDGLCGGPLAHAMGAPLLLIDKKYESAPAEYIAANGIEKGAILGGSAAVSDDTGRIAFGLE